MSIMPVALPPGMYLNGTFYDAKNRWHDGNRVRWHNGAMRAIGGWKVQQNYQGVDLDALSSDVSTSVFRDGFSWVANEGTRYRAWGSNNSLKLWAPDDSIVDITPAGFVGTGPNPTISAGYGRWLYGRSFYGTARPIDPAATASMWRWKFDTFGEDLVAGPSSPINRGGLYLWDVTTGVGIPAAPVANAPTDFNSFVITDQRIAMGIGSDTENRIVRWSDRENITEWTPTQTNYAGFFFIQGNGRLLTIDNVLNQILILSETDAHIGRWINAPLAYGFDRVGDDCGPWNSSVVYTTDRKAMRPGIRTFWMYDGTLKPVECELQDFIAENLDFSQLAKAFVTGTPQYTEITWFFQSKSSATGDVDTYVTYDYAEGHWTKGKLDRTAGIAGEVYVNPYMVSFPEQQINEHERDDIVVDGAYCETGPLELGYGDKNMAVRYIFPDTETFGDVTYTLIGQDQTTDTRYSYGPYTYNNPISTRAMGRNISMRVDGNAVPDWKVGGKTRFDVAPVGTGMR